jgi:hypothetical protein
MNLPSNEHTFPVKIVGERTKHVYEGKFKVKCLLTLEETVEKDLKYDSYTRGSTTLLAESRVYARAVAELEARVIDAPSWWKDSNDGRNLLDKNVVLELANLALDAEKVYDERIEKAAKEAEEELEKQQKRKSEKEKKA